MSHPVMCSTEPTHSNPVKIKECHSHRQVYNQGLTCRDAENWIQFVWHVVVLAPHGPLPQLSNTQLNNQSDFTHHWKLRKSQENIQPTPMVTVSWSILQLVRSKLWCLNRTDLRNSLLQLVVHVLHVKIYLVQHVDPVSYTHLTLPTMAVV